MPKKSHLENLLHCNMLANVLVKTFPHPILNNYKGLIHTRELHDMEGVTEVKRITFKKDDGRAQTGNYIQTFNQFHPRKESKGLPECSC